MINIWAILIPNIQCALFRCPMHRIIARAISDFFVLCVLPKSQHLILIVFHENQDRNFNKKLFLKDHNQGYGKVQVFKCNVYFCVRVEGSRQDCIFLISGFCDHFVNYVFETESKYAHTLIYHPVQKTKLYMYCRNGNLCHRLQRSNKRIQQRLYIIDLTFFQSTLKNREAYLVPPVSVACRCEQVVFHNRMGKKKLPNGKLLVSSVSHF